MLVILRCVTALVTPGVCVTCRGPVPSTGYRMLSASRLPVQGSRLADPVMCGCGKGLRTPV